MFFDIGIIAILLFAALAWGANEPWAMALIAISVFALFAGRLLWDAWHGTSVRFGRLRPFVPLVLFVIYAGLQALTRVTALGATASLLPYTINGYTTTIYLLLSASCVCLAYMVAVGFRSRDRMILLIYSILALGVFEALYGLVQYLGNHEYIWTFAVSDSVAHGTIINRNHYALLLNLCICCGVGYMYCRSINIRRVLGSPGLARLIWLGVWLVLMGLAVIFSMSRMGIAAMLSGIVIMVIAGKTSRGTKRIAVIGTVLVCLILGLAVYTGIDVVLVRYESLGDLGYLERDRIPIWRDAWNMTERHWILGEGLGTFRWSFPAYEKLKPDIPAMYAHNDYLQALSEIGALGLALLFWAFAASWRVAARNLRQSRDVLTRGIGLASLGALTVVALQEITDFSLYIPGVAILLAVLIGLNIRCTIAPKFGS